MLSDFQMKRSSFGLDFCCLIFRILILILRFILAVQTQNSLKLNCLIPSSHFTLSLKSYVQLTLFIPLIYWAKTFLAAAALLIVQNLLFKGNLVARVFHLLP